MHLSTLFTSISHAFASTAKWLAKEAKSTSKVIAKIQAAAPTIEAGTQAILGIVDPGAAVIALKIEELGFAALGHLAHAVDSTDAAASGGLVNVRLDAQAIADFKSVASFLKDHLTQNGTPITSEAVVPQK